jgi:hypothetical protein
MYSQRQVVAKGQSLRLNSLLGGLTMKSLFRASGCAMLALWVTSPAGATGDQVAQYLRSQTGTLSTKALPQFADGKLYACLIEFTNIAQDWAYRQGGLIRVGGSFGVMSLGGKVGVTLKVVVHDIQTGSLKLTPNAPASAYFVSKLTNSRRQLVANQPSDTPGAIFSIFQAERTLDMLVNALAVDKVDIAFNRRIGGSDIPISIDTTVEDTLPNGTKKRSSTSTIEFFDCAKTLLESS